MRPREVPLYPFHGIMTTELRAIYHFDETTYHINKYEGEESLPLKLQGFD